MSDVYGFIGANKGYAYGDFEQALKAKGVSYQERTISERDGLYELTYPHDGQPRYAYVRTIRYEVDGFGQDVYIFSRRVPAAEVEAVLEAL